MLTPSLTRLKRLAGPRGASVSMDVIRGLSCAPLFAAMFVMGRLNVRKRANIRPTTRRMADARTLDKCRRA